MTKQIPNWIEGTGYPSIDASIGEWEYEFAIRRDSGLTGLPRYNLPNGKVEIAYGSAIVQINDDGSFSGLPDKDRNPTTAAVIVFALDQDLDYQLDKAKKFLTLQQGHRYKVNKTRLRVEKYKQYLRILDAHQSGEPYSRIASVIYPYISNEHSDGFKGNSKVADDLKAAKRITKTLLKRRFSRK